MPFPTLIALFQDAPAPSPDSQGTIRLVAGALAVVLLVIVIMRRKGSKKKKEEDEF